MPMIRREKEDAVWLEFELLADIKKISHGLFLRHGGASAGAYSSLNFSYKVEDNPHHVSSNVTKGKRLLGVKDVIRGRLNHGTRVVIVNDGDDSPSSSYDALITQRPDLGLLITHADCQATILYDPVIHVIANVHCGWRGNIENIYQKTVTMMKERFSTKPENLLACISPSLGPDSAEFVNFKTEWPEPFWQFQVKPTYFDLWSLSEHQLIQCGLLPHHIEVARLCTYVSPQDFFSYRREKRSGRHGTIIALKP